MKFYLVISILLSLQLVQMKSVEKGGSIKKASSHKPTKSPKSIVDQFSSLSASDVDFIKELDKQFNVHGDKIKIKVEQENSTSTGEGKTNKRTINGELGYGYQQNYHSNGYYFTKPKYMLYPYSQHDIPPLNTNVQKHVEETVTDIQIQPSHSYELKEINQNYHQNNGYQHGYNNYHNQQNNYHQAQPNAVPVIVLKIPGPAKYAAHLQALLQQYLEIRAAQYIKAFEEQETQAHAAQSAQTVAPVQHYTPHHVAYVSMVPPAHQIYAAVSPQYYMAPSHQPQYQHIYQTHHETENYHSHHHHHHQEEPEQQVVYHQQHQAVQEEPQHQPEAPSAPSAPQYQEEIEHDTPPPQYHHPSSPQPHYEPQQHEEVEYEHQPSPSVGPYQHAQHQHAHGQENEHEQAHEHDHDHEEYHHPQQPQEPTRYVTPYQHHSSPAPHAHVHAHAPSHAAEDESAHLETPENYPSDKHTRVIFKPKEPLPVPAVAQTPSLPPSHSHHTTPYNSQYFAQQQNPDYYHQQNVEYTNDEQIVTITQKPYNYHAAVHSTPQPAKRNAPKHESPYTEEQFKKLNRLINRLKKKSDVGRSESQDRKD